MNFCNLRFFFLATFYFTVCVKAEWSDDRGLIVNQLFGGGFPYVFPPDVRYSHYNRRYMFVESGDTVTRTYYLCPPHPEHQGIHQTCVLPYDLPENELEPRCDGHIVEALVLPIGEQCGKDEDPGVLHQVFYRICKYSYNERRNEYVFESESEKFLNVYEICYSGHHQNQLYSHFAIWKTALLGNDILSNEANVNTTFQDNNPVILNTGTFILQPVLPPQLMAWGVARRTFLYNSNLAYMRSDLIGSWNDLIDQIKTKLINAKVSVQVYAGIYGAITHVNARIIPQVWWITIYNWKLSKGTTIILPNSGNTARIRCDGNDIIVCQNVNLEVPQGMFCCKANFIATLIGIPIRVSKNFKF